MNKTVAHKTDVVFSLLIFCTLAVSVLITLMLGARFYQRMNEMTGDGYEERIGLSYVWTKIKNSDNLDMIYVGDFNGISTLILRQVYGGTTYITRIYPYDGWIYELFSEEGLEFLPENGTPLIKAGSLLFEQTENGLIKISTGSDIAFIHPRGRTGIVRGALE
jgi:hypothetical protein